nr:protein variation in compound triggered root growth response [Quercus suber]
MQNAKHVSWPRKILSMPFGIARSSTTFGSPVSAGSEQRFLNSTMSRSLFIWSGNNKLCLNEKGIATDRILQAAKLYLSEFQTKIPKATTKPPKGRIQWRPPQDLSRCSNFDKLPKNLGNVKGLKRLDLRETAIKELPSSIERLTGLTSLNVCYCKNLVYLPNTTCGFKFHGALDLSTCSRFKNLPENPWIIKGLGMLNLSRTAIEETPSSIGGLIGLTSLTLKVAKILCVFLAPFVV